MECEIHERKQIGNGDCSLVGWNIIVWTIENIRISNGASLIRFYWRTLKAFIHFRCEIVRRELVIQFIKVCIRIRNKRSPLLVECFMSWIILKIKMDHKEFSIKFYKKKHKLTSFPWLQVKWQHSSWFLYVLLLPGCWSQDCWLL